MRCEEKYDENGKLFSLLKHIKPLIVIALLFLAIREPVTADAAGTQVNVTLNYLTETASVTAGAGGSTRFYMSTDKGRNWDSLDYYGSVDISTLLKSKEAEVYFKGNKDTNPKIVTLMAEPNDLTVNYTVANGVGNISFSALAGTSVVYKKGVNGAWNTAYNNMPTAAYEVKGVTLYFRTVATVYRRASKVITVRIGKRPSAPSVKLDGGKFVITGLKPGETEYRVGDASAWITVSEASKIKSISLYTLLGLGTPSNSPLPAGTIEFRKKGAGKKLTSATRLIEIPQQQACPDTVAITGSTLTITDTTPKRVYEYTKVERNAAFNLNTARWTSISSKKSVIIPKVAVYDKILVRIKSTTDSSTKQVIPASTYKEFTITSITTK